MSFLDKLLRKKRPPKKLVIKEPNKDMSKINILGTLMLFSLVMMISLFYFVPYLSEKFMLDSIRQQAHEKIKERHLIRQYYEQSVSQDLRSYAPNIHFAKDHSGRNGKVPTAQTMMEDLSKTFSNELIRYYKRLPKQLKTPTPFQEEAMGYLKTNPEGLYLKREEYADQTIIHIMALEEDQMLEMRFPINLQIANYEKIRDYILILLGILSMFVLYILYRVVLSNEKFLKKEIHSKSRALKTLTSLINDKMISTKMNAQGVIISVSQPLLDISGYTSKELIGKRYSIFHHPDEKKDVYKTMWSVISSGNPWSGKILNRKKDDSSFYIYSTIVPSLDHNGEIIEYTSFSEDITKQVMVEKKLNNDRIFSQTVFDKQDEILIIYNTAREIVNVNQKFFSMFDYPNLEEFLKKHACIYELFLFKEKYLIPNSQEKHWADIVIQNPKTIHKVLMKDRHQVMHIFRVHVKEIEVENTQYHIASFTDITELENARELAESSEKAKASFMANMSHELRTPLNGINGFIQLLSKTPLNEKQERYISLIRTSSSNLIGIVNDILDFSKIESGKMTLSCTKINPFEEFHNILETFKPKTQEKSIQYRTKIDNRIPKTISIDTLRITQVLSNLIGNAIKFTPEGKSIIVTIDLVEHKNDDIKLKFTVQDTGIGIPKSRQKSIFEAFTQADDSTTRKFGGTGLGLNISVSLITLMGGTLLLDSKEGEGSAFSFTVMIKAIDEPLELPEPPPKPKEVIDPINEIIPLIEPIEAFESSEVTESEDKEEKAAPPRRDKPSHLLVVEDNEMNKILMEELLYDYNVTVEYAENGQIAVDKVATTEYDLIFMDINMPVMNGIDATKTIRKRGSKIPIIALTANALKGDSLTFLQAGMTDYISKPIEYDMMEAVIKKYIN